MDKNLAHYPLDVPAPHHYTFAVRDIPEVTIEQRERALNATHWNEFAFPAGMLTVDMLSDSGTTAMTNHQWASLFLGDEAYGRNTGYYVLLDTFRDIFERGGEKNWKKIIDLVRTDCRDVEKMMDEVYLCEYEGGLFNGGAAQMERPNAFIIQQGRAAESVLMEIVRNILQKRYPGKKFTIPSNGHFDTTEGNIKQMGSIPRNLYNKELLWEVPAGGHAVYINMDEFFDGKRGHDTFAGEGFSLELIRRYGIRVSELGDYSMEYDLKTPEQQAEVCNVVRFAIDRSRLTQEHLDYVIAAVKALYEDRENIPNMRIVWGHNLPMRHFHAFLEPYPNEEK